MLECALYFLNVISTASNIDIRFLWIFDTETVATPFIMAFPASMAFLEVLSALTNRDTDVLIVELGTI